MKLWVTGSRDWNDDMALARAITLAIQEMDPEDKVISFIHADREGAEQMFGSYVAKTKSFLSGKGFKVSEYIPSKTLQFSDRLSRIIDQSPTMMIIFNNGKDFIAAKMREAAKANGIKIVEYKNS